MKNIFKLFLLATVLMFASCKEKTTPTQQKTPEVNIVSTVSPADGLDLKLVGSLFQDGKVTDAASLEKELNKEGGINNLDLDGNGKTDYINVSENTGTSTVKSLDLTTGNEKDPTHIATVEVEKGTDGQYNVHMSGSESLYGPNTTYRSSFTPSVSEMLFYSWLFSNRPVYYHRPYYHGYYPPYYSPRVVVSRSVYTKRTTVHRTKVSKTVTKTKSYTPKTKSKNVGKTSTKTRKSIKDSKTANKAFKKQSSSNLKKNGFTNKKKSTTPTSKRKTTSKPKAKPRRTSRPSRSRSSSRRSGRRSDGRYKTNVVALDNALDVIQKMNGVTYYWDTTVLQSDEEFYSVVGTATDKTQQVGFIAQDVEKVAPLLVNTDEYGKQVNYDLTVAYLVEAMKQQQKMIEDLQRQINNNKAPLVATNNKATKSVKH